MPHTPCTLTCDIHVHTHSHTHTNTTHANTHTHILTRTHTLTHTHALVHSHTHTHTHTMQQLDKGDSGKLHLDKGKWCVFSAATIQEFTSVPEAQLIIEATVDFVVHTLMQVCLFVSLFYLCFVCGCVCVCFYYVLSYLGHVRSSCRLCAYLDVVF
jgi:hypothetical protein